jgi:hypothetical protein
MFTLNVVSSRSLTDGMAEDIVSIIITKSLCSSILSDRSLGIYVAAMERYEHRDLPSVHLFYGLQSGSTPCAKAL